MGSLESSIQQRVLADALLMGTATGLDNVKYKAKHNMAVKCHQSQTNHNGLHFMQIVVNAEMIAQSRDQITQIGAIQDKWDQYNQ